VSTFGFFVSECGHFVFVMRFLERNLEDIIFQSSYSHLAKRGLCLPGKRYRQLSIGKYGVADLVYIHRVYYPQKEDSFFSGHTFYVNVVELKKDIVNVNAFLQSVGYIKGLMRYFEKHHPDTDVQYQITLIGSDVQTHNNFPYLFELIKGEVSLAGYTYSYGIDGLKFDKISDWKLVKEGF